MSGSLSGRRSESEGYATPSLAVFLSKELPVCSEGGDSSEAAVTAKDKSFQVCEVCTTHPSQPYMVLKSRWQAHAGGRSHRAAVRRRMGRAAVVAAAIAGPEVEAKRRERQQRRESNTAAHIDAGKPASH